MSALLQIQGRREQGIKVSKGSLGTVMKTILRDARLVGKCPMLTPPPLLRNSLEVSLDAVQIRTHNSCIYSIAQQIVMSTCYLSGAVLGACAQGVSFQGEAPDEKP